MTFLKFLVLCLTASLHLRGTYVSFLLRLLKRLVYLENLLESLGITMSYWDASILLSFLVWNIAYLFGLLQLIYILRLLDRNLWTCKFLIPNLTISLQHRRFISSLCMLYKIFHNPSHPLHSELPNLFRPRRVMRGSLSINSLSFSPMKFHTSQFSRCFIPATTNLWNELPSMIVEATELQNLRLVLMPFCWVWMDCSLL